MNLNSTSAWSEYAGGLTVEACRIEEEKSTTLCSKTIMVVKIILFYDNISCIPWFVLPLHFLLTKSILLPSPVSYNNFHKRRKEKETLNFKDIFHT